MRELQENGYYFHYDDYGNKMHCDACQNYATHHDFGKTYSYYFCLGHKSWITPWICGGAPGSICSYRNDPDICTCFSEDMNKEIEKKVNDRQKSILNHQNG